MPLSSVVDIPSEPAALRAVASGRVQGVCYRRFTAEEATALGLCGTVRNLSDGRVEVIAEGDRQALEQLVRRLQEGPPGALVAELTLGWGEYQHQYDSFEVVHL